MDRGTFYDTMLSLGYEKNTYTYAWEAFSVANKLVSQGWDIDRAVKSSLMGEGLYSGSDT